MKVLQITAHFSPNIGGLETHLDDLFKVLVNKGFKVFVLTYKPLTTKIKCHLYESNNKLTILRIPWFPGLFYKLVSFPILEFIYLLPGLFLFTPIVLLKQDSDMIHAHGLVAGFVGIFWGKLFGKKVVISLHSIYHFPKKGLYRNFVIWILKNADHVMVLSKHSADEVRSLGISKEKIIVFTYWVDLKRFNRISKAKGKLGWTGRFTVLFVGRLIIEKGIEKLLESFKIWNKKINLAIVGIGPLESLIKKYKAKNKNLYFLGVINQDNLPIYYSGADLVIVPSIHEEGFGRVILESLACGTPVIGSNRGAISEAMDESVGKMVDILPRTIKEVVEYFFIHKKQLRRLSKNCRGFAERRYSEINVEKIIKVYKG